MLRILALPLMAMIAPTFAASSAEPIVPFVTEFHHWDHHWYVWLPRDPLYEAVEVMSLATSGSATPLVWAFFTERAPPKRQHHYTNSHDMAAKTGWTYAAIDYATTGGAEGPLGTLVRFTDGQGKSVAINVDFAPGARLSHLGAGLTDQTGHSADRLFLLFYRESAARTEQSAVTIDGIEVSEPRANEPPPPFRAAYSRNIFVGAIPFAKSRVSFGAAIAGELNFREQRSADTAHRLYVATRARGDQIELLADAQGQIERYVDRRGSHTLTVDFSPPVAASDKATYRIGFDEFHDLVAGNVHITRQDGGLVLDWRTEVPAWARNYPLRTQLRREADGSIVLSVSKPVP